MGANSDFHGLAGQSSRFQFPEIILSPVDQSRSYSVALAGKRAID
jgi:hypothetical protein